MKIAGFLLGSALAAALLWFWLDGAAPRVGNPETMPVRSPDTRQNLPAESLVPATGDDPVAQTAAAPDPHSFPPRLIQPVEGVARAAWLPASPAPETANPVPLHESPPPENTNAAPAEPLSPLAMPPRDEMHGSPKERADDAQERVGDPASEVPAGGWRPIWLPFTSELSARGFAERLARITGLDFRIVRLERGRYQLAVSYADPDELAARLVRIESVTGPWPRGGDL